MTAPETFTKPQEALDKGRRPDMTVHETHYDEPPDLLDVQPSRKDRLSCCSFCPNDKKIGKNSRVPFAHFLNAINVICPVQPSPQK